MMILKYEVTDRDDGKAVRHILKNRLEISGKLITKLRNEGKILKNNAFVRTIDIVRTGDIITAEIDFEEESPNVIPQMIDIDIIYEDESIIVLNKQPGIIIHPTCSQPYGTIANALMHHYAGKGLSIKVRPVSRLDKDTSGLIVFAKNQYVQNHLVRQMNDKTFKKQYLGIVHGNFENDRGTICLPIARNPDSIIERIVSEDGAPSITNYAVLAQFKNASLLQFELETGRTHQIRVHCRAISHPLIGDTLYGKPEPGLINRQALHSHKVEFIHPETGNLLKLAARLPDDMLNLINMLK
jgi:23S rRNA pseudouridine1911/1915/1917 synthase